MSRTPPAGPRRPSPTVITFASSKGGVGKSTTCAAVACYLADGGMRVCILDADPNGTIARWARRAPFPGVEVVAAPVEGFRETFKAAQSDPAEYDFILIDLPGFFHVEGLIALLRADLVIVPAGKSEPDIHEAIKKTIRHVVGLSEDNGVKIRFKLLFTRVSPLNNSRVDQWADDFVSKSGIPHFKTGIVDRRCYKDLFVAGKAPHQISAEGRAELNEVVAEITAIREQKAAQTSRGAA